MKNRKYDDNFLVDYSGQQNKYKVNKNNQIAGDPFREYVKAAPQNIMYDRRVVRGNTFAALVIPVNM